MPEYRVRRHAVMLLVCWDGRPHRVQVSHPSILSQLIPYSTHSTPFHACMHLHVHVRILACVWKESKTHRSQTYCTQWGILAAYRRHALVDCPHNGTAVKCTSPTLHTKHETSCPAVGKQTTCGHRYFPNMNHCCIFFFLLRPSTDRSNDETVVGWVLIVAFMVTNFDLARYPHLHDPSKGVQRRPSQQLEASNRCSLTQHPCLSQSSTPIQDIAGTVRDRGGSAKTCRPCGAAVDADQLTALTVSLSRVHGHSLSLRITSQQSSSLSLFLLGSSNPAPILIMLNTGVSQVRLHFGENGS